MAEQTPREELLEAEWRQRVLIKLDNLEADVTHLRVDIINMRGRLWVLSALWGAIGWGAAQMIQWFSAKP